LEEEKRKDEDYEGGDEKALEWKSVDDVRNSTRCTNDEYGSI
jgi:hypothetical protein